MPFILGTGYHFGLIDLDFLFSLQLDKNYVACHTIQPNQSYPHFYRFYLQTFFPTFPCLAIIIVNVLTVNSKSFDSFNDQSAEDKEELSADESNLSYAPDWVSLIM